MLLGIPVLTPSILIVLTTFFANTAVYRNDLQILRPLFDPEYIHTISLHPDLIHQRTGKREDWDQGILSSLNLIGAVVSSAICFKWADVLGRKKEARNRVWLVVLSEFGENMEYGVGLILTYIQFCRWGY